MKPLMHACLVASFLLAAANADAAKKKGAPSAPEPKPEPQPMGEQYEEQIDLGTADVLERLKLLRVQMALDREEIAALRLRIEKIQLQREFEALLGSGQSDSPAPTRVRRTRSDPTQNILVKAITLEPRKEAIIMYQGRIFNVRPGDNVGGVVIKDITEGGLRIQRSRGGSGTIR